MYSISHDMLGIFLLKGPMVNDDRERLDKRYDTEEFRISETASHIDVCEN